MWNPIESLKQIDKNGIGTKQPVLRNVQISDQLKKLRLAREMFPKSALIANEEVIRVKVANNMREKNMF